LLLSLFFLLLFLSFYSTEAKENSENDGPFTVHEQSIAVLVRKATSANVSSCFFSSPSSNFHDKDKKAHESFNAVMNISTPHRAREFLRKLGKPLYAASKETCLSFFLFGLFSAFFLPFFCLFARHLTTFNLNELKKFCKP
jgi:hypothetical protein